MQIAFLLIGAADYSSDMLTHTVRIEEFAVHLHDGLTAPFHDKPRQCCNLGDLCRLQILFVGEPDKSLQILRIDDDSHALLRLRNGKLRAVKSRVLLLDCIEIDDKPVSQLADGNGHTASTKIVAAFDHAADLRIAEQALNLALRRRIAFLHLSAAARQRLLRMLLGRARCPAAAITARTAADEHDKVPSCGTLADNIDLWRSRNDRTDFHTLSHVALMIDFAYLSRRQADLIAISTVASRSAQRDFLLRQLAR